MDRRQLVNIIEAVDYYYDPREPKCPKDILPWLRKLIDESGARFVLPKGASQTVKVLLNGYNVTEASEYYEGDYESPTFAFKNMVATETDKDMLMAKRAIFNALTNRYLDEDLVAKWLYLLANKIPTESQQLKNFLLSVSKLYSKRELIDEVERARNNNYKQGGRSSTQLLFALYDVMARLEELIRLNDKDVLQKEDIGSFMKALHPGELNPLMDAYAALCRRYIYTVTDELYKKGSISSQVYQLCRNPIKDSNDSEAVPMLRILPSSGELAKFLEDKKVQSNIQLVNIVAETFMTHSLRNVKESHSFDSLIGHVIRELKEVSVEESIKRYGNLTCEIEPRDVFKLSHSKRTTNLIPSEDVKGRAIYLVANHLNLELVCKDNDTSEIILISLVKDGQDITSPQMFKTNSNNKEDRCPTLDITRLKLKDPEMLTYQKESNETILLEGLKFSEDGGIKLTYSPKQSYMDEYAQAHKVIHENYKAGNFEAMKTDLAFLFAFINHIESQVVYSNKPVSTSKKEDAIKARMFAINDFKTYLKKVQQHEPTFDFTRYFETIDKEKVLVEFSNSEIKGIRKLLRTILNV